MAVLPVSLPKPLRAKSFTKSVSGGKRDRVAAVWLVSAHPHTGFAGISGPNAPGLWSYRSLFCSDTRVPEWNTCFNRSKSLITNILTGIYASGGSIGRLDHKNGQGNGDRGKE